MDGAMRLPTLRRPGLATRAAVAPEVERLLSGRLAELATGDVASTATVAKLPTVVAIRTLIADVCAMQPLVSLRGTFRLDPQPAVVRRPDPFETRRATVERILNSLTSVGNAYVLVSQQDPTTGWPTAVHVARPSDVTWQLSPWGDRVDAWWWQGQRVDPRRMLHIPLALDPGPIGVAPLTAAQGAFDDLVLLWGFATGYWRDGGLPPYVLQHPRALTTAQSEAIMTSWMTARRTRRPALLSGNVELKDFPTPSAADALLLDGLNYLDATLARVFNVPPSIVNVVSQQSLTYNTTSDELRRWLTLSLYPTYMHRIEDGFSELVPRGQQVVFDTSNLLRADWASRVAVGAQAVAAGLITEGEWRAMEGLPPLESTTDPVQVETPVTVSPSVEGI